MLPSTDPRAFIARSFGISITFIPVPSSLQLRVCRRQSDREAQDGAGSLEGPVHTAALWV